MSEGIGSGSVLGCSGSRPGFPVGGGDYNMFCVSEKYNRHLTINFNWTFKVAEANLSELVLKEQFRFNGMKPTQYKILIFVALLFIVLTVLRIPESRKQSMEDLGAIEQRPVPEKTEAITNSTNPFGSSEAITSSVENKQPTQTIKNSNDCDAYSEKALDKLEDELDVNMDDSSREQLLLLTGLHKINSYRHLDRKSEEYKILMNELSTKRMALLKAKYSESPEQLTAMTILDECLTSKVENLCSEAFINSVISDHSDNGYIWLYSEQYYSEKNPEKQREVIQAILTANEFNSLKKEYVLVLYEFLVNHGLEPPLALIATLGFEAARLAPIGSLFDYCDKNNSPEECLSLGEHLEANGQMIIYEYVGFGLQERYWKAQNNPEAADKIVARKKQFQAETQSAGFLGFPMTDEAVEIYMRALENDREIDSVKQLYQETTRYMQENPDVCVI